MDVCDPTAKIYDGATAGQVKKYNSSTNVVCCDGGYSNVVGNVESDVKVKADNVITTERIVVINGKQVKMKVISFK